MTVPAVNIQAVSKRYGALQALDNVSFEIAQGDFFGLLGPNGAGKTTLISALAGLIRVDSGQLTVAGHDVQKDWRAARRALGVVPQEVVIDPFFTVREMLHLQAGYFGLRKDCSAWIEELLEELDLAAKAEASLRSLSGGMKRRMMIAQALVHRPPVVVLDEPTAGVDVELRRTLWKFIRRLHGEGHTIVLTTHYLEEAEALCDRIAILNDGRVQALDSKDALLARHPFRFLTLTLTAELPGGLQRMVVETIAREGEQVVTLKIDKRTDSMADVLAALAESAVKVSDIRTRDPGLEDVFLELTGEPVDA